jgi:protoheme IX farnesyltransferase
MMKEEKPTLAGKYRYLLLTTSIFTFLLIIMGGIVRVTESGLGCPDWPLCYGRLIPPLRPDAIIEYTHRLVASLTSPLILISGILAWLRYRKVKLIFRPMIGAMGLLVVEVILGAITVLTETPPVIVAIHLGVALTILALVLTATLAGFRLSLGLSLPDRLTFRDPFSRLTVWMVIVLFIVLLSGVFVAGSEATRACAGWPLCNGQLFPTTSQGWIHMAHRFIVAAASVLVIVLLIQAWRTQRGRLAIYPAAAITFVFFFAQAYVGALKTTHNFPPFFMALHVATAAATWASLISLTVLAGTTAPETEKAAVAPVKFSQYLRDLFTLTRPVVVLLLLVTAFAAMVVGGRAWPSLSLAFWTLLGGGMAAGGAQAVNQFVDRDIDKLMLRTAKRPIPTGRLSPAEGLAWGLSLCVVSVFILAGQVNWLAALMTLVGIIYYVFIYTLLLKRTSVQNIVIGGGAGAMAPVVGLVAVTGRLDLWALLLFGIVFFWTPPHFWALALVRLRDYTAAKIPVMPVVRGVNFTRTQIMVYTVCLLPITLLPFLFGIAGWIYLAAAILLDIGLVYVSWMVWRRGTNKMAWQLYRVSSMYLAFLFFAMMADKLVK